MNLYRISKAFCLTLLCLLLLACIPLEEPLASTPNESVDGNTESKQQSAMPELTIHMDATRGEISPYIFGTNYGPWVSLRPETLPIAEAGGFTMIRYPGGEFGDKNKLRTYQIDQLVDLSRRLGAEPYIHVRLPDSSPDEAAEAVQYANVDKGYGIKFWSIGNEPSLYAGAEIGKGWIKEVVWDTAYFNEQWRLYAEAMRAVDPSILLMGPEIHQWSNAPGVAPKDPSGRDWLTEFLRANGDLVDVVTFHRYPFPNNPERRAATIPELRANPVEWEAIVPAVRKLIREETGRELPIGVTEINSHWSLSLGGEATSDSFYHAIWWADVLARMIDQQVEYVNQFVLTGNALGLIGKYDALPTYYVYKMYQSLGSELVESASSNQFVTITAARREDGVLTAVLVNRGDEAATMGLTGVANSVDEVILFDQTHTAEAVGLSTVISSVDDLTHIELPAESIVTLVFSQDQ
ncbi:MAG: hypothetical protein AAF702_18225 [Chloroflexota bacterium]